MYCSDFKVDFASPETKSNPSMLKSKCESYFGPNKIHTCEISDGRNYSDWYQQLRVKPPTEYSIKGNKTSAVAARYYFSGCDSILLAMVPSGIPFLKRKP